MCASEKGTDRSTEVTAHVRSLLDASGNTRSRNVKYFKQEDKQCQKKSGESSSMFSSMSRAGLSPTGCIPVCTEFCSSQLSSVLVLRGEQDDVNPFLFLANYPTCIRAEVMSTYCLRGHGNWPIYSPGPTLWVQSRRPRYQRLRCWGEPQSRGGWEKREAQRWGSRVL